MLKSLMSKWRQKRGFTMTEVMVVVAIIAVVAAIAIPSAIAIRNSLQFQERNNYARSIFLAAQTELMEMRSSGELEKLPEVNNEAGSSNIAISQKDGAATPSGYIYTTRADTTYFEMLLPAGSIDETVRDGQIIIEYSPRTGNIYAVFYYEGNDDVLAKYSAGQLTRKEDERKKMKLGYYDGSDLADPDLGVYYVKADVSFENGHEGMVTVVVPAQARVSGGNINFMGDNYNAYANGLEVTLTVTGEQGGTFTKTIKTYGNADNCTVSSGEGGVNAIYVSFPMDSLADMGSFASLAENNVLTEGETEEARTLTAITDKNDFVILPGDNVSITAEVSFRPGMDDPMVIIESAAIAGVNPMFDSLTPGTNGYILAVSNGRNLQNLNAIAPEIAEKVEAVVFNPSALGKPAGTDPVNIIDWNDTVAYYNNKYGTGSTGYTNSSAEAPARALPYFVPIHNEYLFGTAVFEDDDTNVGRTTPELVEIDPRGTGVANADIVGNDVRIYNLNIDTSKYFTGDANYTGNTEAASNHKFTGLFGYVNTRVDRVYVVNPVIRGEKYTTDGRTYASAAGALIGAAGEDTYISHCGAYIDTTATDFVRTDLNMGSFTGTDNQYGVSGYGAVGGLVGYAKSNKAVNTVFDSFGAVPVYGEMKGGNYCGYLNGIGGLVGNAQMVKFSDCYASGYVGASGDGVTETITTPANTETNTYNGIGFNGEHSTGAGGFVGTSLASTYQNCFATGNVMGNDASTGAFVGVMCYNSKNGVTTQFTACYALGNAFFYYGVNNATYENFSGVNAAIHDVPTDSVLKGRFANCFYLSGYRDGAQHNDATEYCAESATYPTDTSPNFLSTMGGIEGWVATTAQTTAQTHSYDGFDTKYPFAMLSGMDYYGSWPAQPSKVGLAYYEIYESGEPGYYYDRQGTSTLKNGVVVTDGYAILSASDDISVQVTVGTTTTDVKNLTREADTLEFSGSAYHVFILPEEALTANATSFYTTVKVHDNDKNSDYTMYFNPNVALSQVNGATTAPKDAPSTIYVRSARQLAALGSESIQKLTDKSFIQQLDIDFSIAKDVTLSGNSVVSTFGKNTYNGDKHTITGAEMTIFGTNNGRILNCTVIGSADKKLATTVNGFVATNDGTIQNCSITGPGSISGAAGFVTTNSGTIENCYVTPVAKGTGYTGKSNAELSISGCGFATTNSGTIKNCYVLGTVNGSAGFVETNNGTIENCKANVNMSGDGKYAFVQTNDCEVKTSYGWVTGSATLTTPGAKGCYFALMNSEENAILYNAEGKSENCSLDELAEPSALTALGAGWNAAKSNNAYPYKKGLTQYPFPMIGNHYGDWTTGGGSLSYGVLYYEKYSNGYWYVDKVNLSAYDDMPYEGEETTTNLERSDVVENAGYVFYCRAGKTPFDSVSNNLMGQVTEISGLHQQADLSTRYSFYPIDVTKMGTNQVTVTVTGATKDNSAVKSVSFTPFFADTLPGADKDLTKYKIRTQAQLENISRAYMEKYVIDRKVVLGEGFKSISKFTGTLEANGNQIVMSNTTSGLFDTLRGTVTGVHLYAESALFSGTAGMIANTLDGGTIKNCENDNVVQVSFSAAASDDNVGILVGKMVSGTIDTCEVNGNVTVAVGNSNAAVGGVVGRVSGGTISNVTSNAKVESGSGEIGMFVGAADGGTFTNCKTTAANTDLHFAGKFEKDTVSVDTETVDATHYTIGDKPKGDGSYESVDDFAKGDTYIKARNVTFTNCSYDLNGKETHVTQQYHFYKIAQVDSYEPHAEGSGFVSVTTAPAYSAFKELGDTWTATQYYVETSGTPEDQTDDVYHRLYVKVETEERTVEISSDETVAQNEQDDQSTATEEPTETEGKTETITVYKFTFGHGALGEDNAPVNKGKVQEVTDLTTAISYNNNPLFTVRSAPNDTSAKYVLANAEGKVLTFNNNHQLAFDHAFSEITDGEGMIWTIEADGSWTVDREITVKSDPEKTVVQVDNVEKEATKVMEAVYTISASVSRKAGNDYTGNKMAVALTYKIVVVSTEYITIDGKTTQTPTPAQETNAGTIQAYIYTITPKTTYKVTYTDISPVGLNPINLETAQTALTADGEETVNPAKTAALVSEPEKMTNETETSTAPDGAAEVPVDGNDETEH